MTKPLKFLYQLLDLMSCKLSRFLYIGPLWVYTIYWVLLYTDAIFIWVSYCLFDKEGVIHWYLGCRFFLTFLLCCAFALFLASVTAQCFLHWEKLGFVCYRRVLSAKPKGFFAGGVVCSFLYWFRQPWAYMCGDVHWCGARDLDLFRHLGLNMSWRKTHARAGSYSMPGRAVLRPAFLTLFFLRLFFFFKTNKQTQQQQTATMATKPSIRSFFFFFSGF